MNDNTYHAVQFVIANANSYGGVIDYSVEYHAMTKTWTVTAGQFSLVIDREIVDELIAELALA